MAISKAEQKRAQKLQAKRNAGLPDDLAWADMTGEQRTLVHHESMKLFHQRKSNGNTPEHAVADSTSPTPGSVNGARTSRASRSQRRLSYQQVVERLVDLVEESELYTPDDMSDELFAKAVDATKKVLETIHDGDMLGGILMLSTIIDIAFAGIEE